MTREAAFEWHIGRHRTVAGQPPDVTLINLNLMLVKYDNAIDRQNFLPLGPLYLAAFLEADGCNVEFIDYQLYSGAKLFDAEAFVGSLGSVGTVVGISCMSNLLPFATCCARELRRRFPRARIVLGGVGPSPVAREIVGAFDFIDAVVEGEGEIPLRDFVRGDPCRLPPRNALTDLDQVPLPAYHLLSIEAYDAAPSVITSRGCPYRCAFCTEPHNFGGRVRYRSIASIIADIETVHAGTGRTMFLFQDDILPLHRKRFLQLLDAFSSLSFSMTWKCFARVDLINDELMERMANAGCVQVRYGIESGSNRILQRIYKGFGIQQAYEVAARSRHFFPSVHASFIWGYPFESLADYEQTLEWVSRFEDAGISVLLFELSPLPGSQLYRDHQADLVYAPENYSSFVLTGHETVTADRVRPQRGTYSMFELVRQHPEVFSGFYSWRSQDHELKKRRLQRYARTRRTAVKNEYDL